MPQTVSGVDCGATGAATWTWRRDGTVKPRGLRPVDEVADQRRLVTEGQAVHDAGLGVAFAGEQGAAQRVGLDGHVHDVLALGERLETRSTAAIGLPDDDVDLRMAHQRLPVLADVRRAVRQGGVDSKTRRFARATTDASEIGQCRGRIEIGDGDDVHSRRFRMGVIDYSCPNLPVPIMRPAGCPAQRAR